MNRFERLSLSSLRFDLENPRLPTSVRNTDEETILRYLGSRTGIENLMTSIAENDFFPGEAIVVLQDSEESYTVIEGNRRLAALRLLQDPSVLNIPRIKRAADDAKHRPIKVPAFIVESRAQTLQYLGFRHISGVQRWDPLAKGRYLKQLFAHVDGAPSERYTGVAREIGSNNSTVRRNLDALAAYTIVQEAEFFDIPEISESTFQFGTFYTAISNSDIATFVGITKDKVPQHPIVNAEVIGRDTLEELVRYMFEKNAQGDTILVESRNIGKLGFVLAHPPSLDGLRQGMSLETAYRLSPRGREDFQRHMTQSLEHLKQATANLYAVDKTDKQAAAVVEEATSGTRANHGSAIICWGRLQPLRQSGARMRRRALFPPIRIVPYPMQ